MQQHKHSTRSIALAIAGQLFLIMACYVQCAHAAKFFGTLNAESILSQWLYAIALEGTVYIFTLARIKWAAYSFAGVSVALNMLLYWANFTGLQAALGSVLVSISLPFAIAMYSFLNEHSLKSSEQLQLQAMQDAEQARIQAEKEARKQAAAAKRATMPPKRRTGSGGRRNKGTVLPIEKTA